MSPTPRTAQPPAQPQPDAAEVAAVMAALGDPVRVAIVRALAAGGERACGTFELGVAKATRSHHLRVLREAGLTHTRPEGTHRYVSLRRDWIEERFPGLLDAIGAGEDAAPAPPTTPAAR